MEIISYNPRSFNSKYKPIQEYVLTWYIINNIGTVSVAMLYLSQTLDLIAFSDDCKNISRVQRIFYVKDEANEDARAGRHDKIYLYYILSLSI